MRVYVFFFQNTIQEIKHRKSNHIVQSLELIYDKDWFLYENPYPNIIETPESGVWYGGIQSGI